MPSQPQHFLDGPLPCTITGDDAQVLEIAMQAGDRFVCEGSSLLYLLGSVQISIEWGEGMMTPLWRKYSGEDLLLSDLVASGPAIVGLSPPQWGRILRVPLRQGGVIFTSPGAYMAHTGDVNLTVGINRRIRSGLFGSKGMVFQRHAGHGDVFLHAYGHIVSMDLPAEQALRVSPGNILAFEGTVGLDAQISASALTLLMGKQEAILDELRGPGKVWLQSLDTKPPVATRRKPSPPQAAAP